ncbi:microsomal signal peptidase 12 kDa subunit-domain-containing protein [Pyronema domesticum]|uniref:Signal peptidase complex subunit 1 n=1 Tax=Pyronema omphalodes (strain CBS 100304) TaxID=1076935 RepID=U4L6I6_PYROM|nr:microsomal signal peptidase 12 kDa subunit-domain-containing protein [Pyronema domesticum]CCX12090.1 Similar to Probable signal peptidase complex subunit 1; acc. no. O44953 [Pyronema omphalodes CBS 100304]
MDSLQSLILDGFIDFEGQKLADFLTTVLLIVFGAIAWIVGFLRQDLMYTVYIGLGGTALTFLAVVPPWPFYNKNPQRWLAAGEGDRKLQ